MEVNGQKLSGGRILIYLLGILFVSLGIVLCKKCGLGISPISSIPFVLADIAPLSFGNLTTLFHFVNIALQMLLIRKIFDLKLWLQVPLAFVFGWTIDWLNNLIVLDHIVLAWQLLALVFSILFTALGMVMMIDMNLVQNPPDGAVKQISIILNKELGNVKIIYDVSCIVISILLSLIFLRKIQGFGIATIVSAIFVGKVINWIRMAYRLTGCRKNRRLDVETFEE